MVIMASTARADTNVCDTYYNAALTTVILLVGVSVNVYIHVSSVMMVVILLVRSV